MERALWNNKEYYANDVVNDFDTENKIRKASHKELFCPDSQCNTPILRYCHGEKKRAYFAHIKNSKCDYGDFDRKNKFIREIRIKLFQLFREKGYDVKIEQKLLPKHYAQLEVKIGGKSIAIEIGTKATTASQISFLEEEYGKRNINLEWIVIGDIQPSIKENGVFFLKRYELNRSAKNDLIVISHDATKAIQYRMDTKEYSCKNIDWREFQEIYSENAGIEELCFEKGTLTLLGFNQRYEQWLRDKQPHFIQEIKRLENYRSQPLFIENFSY